MEIINDDFVPIIKHHDIYTLFNSVEVKNKFDNLIDMWDFAVNKFSDRVAICDGDKFITYDRLDKYSNGVANMIIAEKTRDNQKYKNGFIMVRARRDWETIGIIIGVLKSGMAYVPISGYLPQKRIDKIADIIGSDVILDADIEYKEQQERPIVKISAGDCAYVIFTSGSTGEPKGVMIPHCAVADTMQSVNKHFGLTEYDKVLGVSDLTFDLSVFDLFGTFESGAMLILLRDKNNIQLYLDLIKRHNISFINCVPLILSSLLNYLEMTNTGFDILKSLKSIVLSGDVVSFGLVRQIMDKLYPTNLYIMGGPTEITVWSNIYLYDDTEYKLQYVPYGTPIFNKSMIVISEEKPIVEGKGELYSGKKGLALGFINDLDMTKENFVMTEAFGRVYKTGDSAMLTKDGVIKILGRLDNQVKLNGYRLELEEIERAINSIEGVTNSVATIIQKKGVDCLYAITKTNTKTKINDIKEKISQLLPSYAVPQEIYYVDTIPMSQNNKINREKAKEYLEKIVL